MEQGSSHRSGQSHKGEQLQVASKPGEASCKPAVDQAVWGNNVLKDLDASLAEFSCLPRCQPLSGFAKLGSLNPHEVRIQVVEHSSVPGVDQAIAGKEVEDGTHRSATPRCGYLPLAHEPNEFRCWAAGFSDESQSKPG